MRIAYADPPYPGQSKKHYSHDPRCAEVDHAALVADLCRDYPDGWALSTSEPALEHVTDCCKAAGLSRSAGDYRVAAWVKPFASFKPNVNPAFTWEPVIVRGGRKSRSRKEPTVRDHFTDDAEPDCVRANITLKKGLCGAKPEKFCFWLFDFLGLGAGDELVDLYPGTGAVTAAWAKYLAERSAA